MRRSNILPLALLSAIWIAGCGASQPRPEGPLTEAKLEAYFDGVARDEIEKRDLSFRPEAEAVLARIVQAWARKTVESEHVDLDKAEANLRSVVATLHQRVAKQRGGVVTGSLADEVWKRLQATCPLYPFC